MPIFLRRGGWKPWSWSTRTWLLAILVGFALSPFIARWVCLWQVPDVKLLVNVEDVIPSEIRQEDDAVFGYVAAVRSFDRIQLDYISNEQSFDSIEEWYKVESAAVLNAERKWDPRLDAWLATRRQSLVAYERASEMKRAGGPSLKSADYQTTVNEHQRLRNLVRMASLEAVRRQRRGDSDAALNCHLMNLRCARHCQMPRFNICHLIGLGIRSYAYHGIAHWAELPSLTLAQLQLARDELRTDADTRVPTSELIEANYLLLRNWISQPEGPNYLFPRWSMAKPEEPSFLFGKKMVMWAFGEPEVLLRLARQTLDNNFDQIDRPLHQRGAYREVQCELVFLEGPGFRRRWGTLDPKQLATGLETHLSTMKDLEGYLLGGKVLDGSNRADDARRITLEVTLAAHQFQRRNGEFPETFEQLVPTFLTAVPIDPMSVSGDPLRYRREQNGEAIVWSIGWDNVDDGGNVEEVKTIDIGYRIRLDQPLEMNSEKAEQEKQSDYRPPAE